VALLTRNRSAGSVADVRDRAVANAQRAVPAAKDAAQRAVPAAKDVTSAVRSKAEDAAAWARPKVDDTVAWAKPHVDDARAWAAPVLERSAGAVQETIAPAIAGAMVSAARTIEVKPKRGRKWAKSAAITMLVAAAASAAAAILLRRRPATPVFPPVDPDSPVDPAFGEAGSVAPEPEVNGRPLDT
jgi:hypothetical protein